MSATQRVITPSRPGSPWPSRPTPAATRSRRSSWRDEVAADGRRRVPHTSGSQMSALGPGATAAGRASDRATRVRQAQAPGDRAARGARPGLGGRPEPYRVTAVSASPTPCRPVGCTGSRPDCCARDITAVPCSQLSSRPARRRAGRPGHARHAADLAAARRSVRGRSGHVPGMSTWTVHLPTATSARCCPRSTPSPRSTPAPTPASRSGRPRRRPGRPGRGERHHHHHGRVVRLAVTFTGRRPHGGDTPADSQLGRVTDLGPNRGDAERRRRRTPRRGRERGEACASSTARRAPGRRRPVVRAVPCRGPGRRVPAAGRRRRPAGQPGHRHPPRRSDLVTGAVRGQDPTTYRPGGGHRPRRALRVTAPAASQAAPPQPDAPSSTTSSPTPPVPPRRPTCSASAPPTTASSTTPAGNSP